MHSYTLSTLASVQQLPIMMLNEFAKTYTEKGQAGDLLLAIHAIPTLQELQSQGLLQAFLDINEDEKHELRQIANIQSSSQEEAICKAERDNFRQKLACIWGGCSCELFEYKEIPSSRNLMMVTKALGICQEEFLARFGKYLERIGADEEELATYEYLTYGLGTIFNELKKFQRVVLKTLDIEKEKKEAFGKRQAEKEANISNERRGNSPQQGKKNEEKEEKKKGLLRRKQSCRQANFQAPK